MRIRLLRKTSYTALSNNCIRSMRLSLKAKGLLALMLSLPDDWEFSVKGLVSMCQEGERAVTAALDELKMNGYVAVKKYLPNETESKRFEYEYIVSDEPLPDESGSEQDPRFVGQDPQKQGVQNQPLQNVPLAIYNNKIKKTKERIQTECSLHSHSVSAREAKPRFVKPTAEEVQAYCNERGNGINAEEFIAHYESNGWVVGRSPMKDWKAAVRTWELKRRQSPLRYTDRQQASMDAIDRLMARYSEEESNAASDE